MEPFTKLAENETAQLQRAVFAQYIMMKKLFMELEEEREASSSAASAALSMIRKLQKEKEAEFEGIMLTCLVESLGETNHGFASVPSSGRQMLGCR